MLTDGFTFQLVLFPFGCVCACVFRRRYVDVDVLFRSDPYPYFKREFGDYNLFVQRERPAFPGLNIGIVYCQNCFLGSGGWWVVNESLRRRDEILSSDPPIRNDWGAVASGQLDLCFRVQCSLNVLRLLSLLVVLMFGQGRKTSFGTSTFSMMLLKRQLGVSTAGAGASLCSGGRRSVCTGCGIKDISAFHLTFHSHADSFSLKGEITFHLPLFPRWQI